MNKRRLFLVVLVSLALGLILTACGPSAATLAIQQTATIEEVQGLNDKLTWLEGNVKTGGNYTIELNRDEGINKAFSNVREFSYKNVNNVTITIKGVGENRTIIGKVKVGSGVTLILDNITIKSVEPRATKHVALPVFSVSYGGTLVLNSGTTITGGYLISTSDRQFYSSVTEGFGGGVDVTGTLIMNEGSAIISNRHTSQTISNGGGVRVEGGTFIMKGGLIASNICMPSHEEIQSKKQIQANTKAVGGAMGADMSNMSPIDENCKGGGVYVSEGYLFDGFGSLLVGSGKKLPIGTFIKTGGTIVGYNSDAEKGNKVVNVSGQIVNGNGHAIYFDIPKDKGEKISIDTTVGPEITLEFKDGVLKEGRAEAAPVAPIAEPVAEETASEQPADAPAETPAQEQ